MRANKRNLHGNTPLHLAAMQGYSEAVKYLVEDAQVNPNEKNKYDETPLYLAVMQGRIEVVKYLIEQAHALIDEKDKRIFALSQFSEDEFNRLKTLIDKKNNHIDLQVADFKHSLFTSEDVEFIKRKLDKLGTNEAKALSAKLLDKSDNFLLDKAYGQLEIMKYLVEDQGVDCQSINHHKLILQQIAQSPEMIEIVSWLKTATQKQHEQEKKILDFILKKISKKHILSEEKEAWKVLPPLLRQRVLLQVMHEKAYCPQKEAWRLLRLVGTLSWHELDLSPLAAGLEGEDANERLCEIIKNSRNILTFLKVQNCTLLTEVTFENFPRLQTLDMKGCSELSLTLAQLPCLTVLSVDNKVLKEITLKEVPGLAHLLSSSLPSTQENTTSFVAPPKKVLAPPPSPSQPKLSLSASPTLSQKKDTNIRYSEPSYKKEEAQSKEEHHLDVSLSLASSSSKQSVSPNDPFNPSKPLSPSISAFRLIDVSGFGNNCGLFALALGIKLALAKRPDLASQYTSVDFLQCLSEKALQTYSAETKETAGVLRETLGRALEHDREFKQSCFEPFVACVVAFLNNKPLPLDREAFHKPKTNRAEMQTLKDEWKKWASLLSERKVEAVISVIENVTVTDKNIERFQADLVGVGKELNKQNALFSITELFESWKEDFNSNDARSCLIYLKKGYQLAWAPVTEDHLPIAKRQLIQSTVSQYFRTEYRKQLSSCVNPDEWTELLLTFGSLEHLTIKEGVLKPSAKPEPLPETLQELYVMSELQKGKTWDKVYETYCQYASDPKNQMELSADELGCLARSWNVQLTIEWPNGNHWQASEKKAEGRLSVTLANPSQSHWQVVANEEITSASLDQMTALPLTQPSKLETQTSFVLSSSRISFLSSKNAEKGQDVPPRPNNNAPLTVFFASPRSPQQEQSEQSKPSVNKNNTDNNNELNYEFSHPDEAALNQQYDTGHRVIHNNSN